MYLRSGTDSTFSRDDCVLLSSLISMESLFHFAI